MVYWRRNQYTRTLICQSDYFFILKTGAILLSFFSGRLMESPSAVRLNRTGPYPSSSTFLIFCGNSLLSAANYLMITFPFSGQARTVAYKSFLVWVKRISCAVALLYAPSLNPCALILISASAIGPSPNTSQGRVL